MNAKQTISPSLGGFVANLKDRQVYFIILNEIIKALLFEFSQKGKYACRLFLASLDGKQPQYFQTWQPTSFWENWRWPQSLANRRLLNLSKIEDDLNFVKMENKLNFFKDGRWPQIRQLWYRIGWINWYRLFKKSLLLGYCILLMSHLPVMMVN